jgi:hypothetical protein
MNHTRMVLPLAVGALLLMLSSEGCEDTCPTEPCQDMALVGTWKVIRLCTVSYTWAFCECDQEEELNGRGTIWILRFSADGTAGQDIRWAAGDPLETLSGTWKICRSKLMLDLTSEAGKEVRQLYDEYMIDGDVLVLMKTTRPLDQWTDETLIYLRRQ